MALKKMKKTPTGWGTGYIGVSTIACRKISGIKIKCTLSALPPSKEEKTFTGTEIHFESIDVIRFYGDACSGFNLGKETMACHLATGIIKCIPEELK